MTEPLAPPLALIDAHHHLWDLGANHYPWLQGDPPIEFRYGDYTGIRRNYMPADFLRDTANQNLVASVHMEAEFDPADPVAETRWVHEIAEVHGFPHAVVGQAWFARDDIDDVLSGHAAFPLVRGVRQKPAAAASPVEVEPGAPGSMGDPKFRTGYALMSTHGFSYDLQTPWWHLPEATELARDFPETTIILNHTGLPADRSEEVLAGWLQALQEFAAEPNTALKISGLGVKGRPWTVADNRHVVLAAIQVFGAERCMFASNFPVDRVVADYDTIMNGFREITSELPEEDQRKLFRDNAARYYRIALMGTVPIT